MSNKKNIILIGASRAGKSTCAEMLWNKLDSYHYFNSDIIVDAYGNAQRESSNSEKNRVSIFDASIP